MSTPPATCVIRKVEPALYNYRHNDLNLYTCILLMLLYSCQRAKSRAKSDNRCSSSIVG